MTTTTTQNPHDAEYLKLLEDVLENGEYQTTRAVLKSTGRPVGAYTVFGRQSRFNLRKGFPILTTKQVPFRLVASELLWFLSGSSDVKKLQEQNNHIWDEWATKEQCAKFGREEGDLGPVYGPLWRKWDTGKPQYRNPQNFVFEPGSATLVTDMTEEEVERLEKSNEFMQSPWTIDQIANVIQQIKTSPTSRRLIVSGWNPATCDKVSLPPCHTMFQFKVTHDNTRLSCQLYQRSGDIFLGIPFNIASYALLTHMVAQAAGLEVGEFIHTFGDLHVYENHVEQAKEQLSRASSSFSPPTLVLDPTIKNIDDFKLEHLKLQDYQSHPAIKGEVAV
jgi:thymidylate synthase